MMQREVAVARLVLGQLSQRPAPAGDHIVPWVSGRPGVLDAADPFVALSVPLPTPSPRRADEPPPEGRVRRRGKPARPRVRTVGGADLQDPADGAPPPGGGPLGGVRATAAASAGRDRSATVRATHAGAAPTAKPPPLETPTAEVLSAEAPTAKVPAGDGGAHTGVRRLATAGDAAADTAHTPALRLAGGGSDGSATGSAQSLDRRRATTGRPAGANRSAAITRIGELAAALQRAPRGAAAGDPHTPGGGMRERAVPPDNGATRRIAAPAVTTAPAHDPSRPTPAGIAREPARAAGATGHAADGAPPHAAPGRLARITNEHAVATQGDEDHDGPATATTLPGPWTRPVRQMLTGVASTAVPPAAPPASVEPALPADIDSQAVAEAVAGVLAEQARRNGVDVP
jgi:hypothetical protein